MGKPGGLMLAGLLLVVLGLAGFAVPYFTTPHTENVAKIGSVSVQATEQKPHSIPPELAGGVLVLGLIFVGVGIFRRA